MRLHACLSLMILACLPGLATANDNAQIVSVDPVARIVTGSDAPVMRISFPAKGRALPIVILSHGNRLSRGDYQPLVAALVRSGHVVIQPDHPDASQEGFAPSAPQPEDAWRTRVEQIRWVAAHVRRIADATPGLRGRIDPRRIALVGHSFGGHSVALAMGASVTGQPNLPPIEGISAAVLLAPPGGYEGLTPEWKARAPYLRTDWRAMRGPMLIINGEKDAAALSDKGPGWHNDSFTQATAGQDICLMVVKDAGHYLGGIDSVLRPPAGDATPEKREMVLDAIVTFLGDRLDSRADARTRWASERAGLACK
ncbi:MAG: alpha/beta fold hydrolase [Sphingobium sp.]